MLPQWTATWLNVALTLLGFLVVTTTLGLSALLLEDVTPREAGVVLVRAACVLAIIAVLEGLGRWRNRAR